MPSDSGPGIPGWFIAAAVLVALLGVGSVIWRITVARQIAQDAGLDPATATKVALLSDDGVDAAYIASAVASRQPSPPTAPAPVPKTTAERLQELQAVKDKGLITDEEYAAQRQNILGSI